MDDCTEAGDRVKDYGLSRKAETGLGALSWEIALFSCMSPPQWTPLAPLWNSNPLIGPVHTLHRVRKRDQGRPLCPLYCSIHHCTWDPRGSSLPGDPGLSPHSEIFPL